MTDKSNIITINDKEYNREDLSNEQNYFIQQISNAQAEYNQHVAAADRANATKDMFTNRLIQSLKEEDKTS